jgi:4a-hydroxytetrahydrobiopterin dehydratase
MNSFAASFESLSNWENLSDRAIARTFKFENYYQTMAFVNAVAFIAHGQDHHPDLQVGYNKCRVEFSTHSAGGLSEKDFVAARAVEDLLK